MSTDQIAELHRDLSQIKETLGRLDERLVRYTDTTERVLGRVDGVEDDVRDLRSRVDMAQAQVGLIKWASGLGGGAGIAAFIQSLMGS